MSSLSIGCPVASVAFSIGIAWSRDLPTPATLTAVHNTPAAQSRAAQRLRNRAEGRRGSMVRSLLPLA